ncbi:hypothetical protein ASPWEDRAFT_61822 [Aspergillus wentii DTO 134E9]|uniref:Uncharacterized protein n=1 Tax=Aspergillus wentii DTO 134E9 TaxID=1073089 RepID=A0A1L9RAU8_ASPWE|nr:uncharacterized protein ASPWEDRAFT_61822 [Aspergillus wentii DTO 134E9]KAI9934622.1 hypothetical protein MW887_000238 [Aspergillus wentii]OJJ32044.1 hypothetical protein ASPWEDRAFT_61822 [Aspergillus wentii DTO 134E9]
MSPPTHHLSINIYGRGDATLGDGPSHMGIAIYEQGSSTCEMHHIRNPTDQDFIYDPRPQPLEDPVLKGRCELASLSDEQRIDASALLTSFGKNESNIPEFGVGNCQDWVAAAVGVLERVGLVGSGEGGFWRGMVNKSAEEMKSECLRTGRRWIDGPELVFEGDPDARFGDEGDEARPVGKLGNNEAFLRMKSLFGERKDGESQERPFYVSSPFFSKMEKE